MKDLTQYLVLAASAGVFVILSRLFRKSNDED